MAKVESKTNISIEMEVIGKNGKRKGHFSLTSGNLYYYRKNAKTATKKYTYQQLISLIESDMVE